MADAPLVQTGPPCKQLDAALLAAFPLSRAPKQMIRIPLDAELSAQAGGPFPPGIHPMIRLLPRFDQAAVLRRAARSWTLKAAWAAGGGRRRGTHACASP